MPRLNRFEAKRAAIYRIISVPISIPILLIAWAGNAGKMSIPTYAQGGDRGRPMRRRKFRGMRVNHIFGESSLSGRHPRVAVPTSPDRSFMRVNIHTAAPYRA